MTQQLDERKIIEALNKVATIDGSSDIVSAGAVSGVVIKEGHVSLTIEIDPNEQDHANELRVAAEKAILEVEGVLSATALLTAHPAAAPTWWRLQVCREPSTSASASRTARTFSGAPRGPR